MEEQIKIIIDTLMQQRLVLLEKLSPMKIQRDSYYDSGVINSEIDKIDLRIDKLLLKIK